MDEYRLDFSSLREKWRELPHESGDGGGRVFSDELLLMDRSVFIETWQMYYYRRVELARWCYELYKEFMRGKAVLEIGSGLGFDGISFLQKGVKNWTFCDIAKTNLDVILRVCEHLDLRADFVFIDDNFECFDKLGMYDVIWANGSLINVPFEFARAECMKILPHLKPRGRWIELCYPRERWIREGKPPFSEWGKMTDGERTPWVEWYDLIKIKRRLFPAPLEVVLDFSFNNGSMNWFDLIFESDRPFDAKCSVFDLDILPLNEAAECHGDTVFMDNGDEFLEVITPAAIWSYAVSFDLATSIEQMNGTLEKVSDSFTVEIELLVSHGHIGILIVGEDISTPVCQEYMVPANTEPATVTITVPPTLGGRRLIFRNTAAGTRSQFKLQRIRLRFVTADKPGWTERHLSADRASPVKLSPP